MAMTDRDTIAVWATAREAFDMVWAARRQHVIISVLALLPFIIMAVAGWLDPVLYMQKGAKELPPGFWPAFLPTMVWGLGWVTVCLIFWFRLFLLGPQQFLQVTTQEVAGMWARVAGYGVLLIFILLVASFMAIALITSFMMPAITQGGAVNPVAAMISAIIGTVLIIFIITISIRSFMTFLGIAIGEKIPIRLSWHIVRGHTFKLFLTILAVSLPAALFADIVLQGIIYLIEGQAATTGTTTHLGTASYIAMLILSPLTYAPSALGYAVFATAFHHLRPAEQTGQNIDINV